MSHIEILRMIEEVDLNDTAKLDEIDARVWCYLYRPDKEFCGVDKYHFRYKGEDQYEVSISYQDTPTLKQFTRSRDALKAIRPEGWWFSITPNDFDKFDVVGFRQKEIMVNATRTRFFPTEELAELHAIIQAIAYERKNNEKI